VLMELVRDSELRAATRNHDGTWYDWRFRQNGTFSFELSAKRELITRKKAHESTSRKAHLATWFNAMILRR
jgi:hypothetical protein